MSHFTVPTLSEIEQCLKSTMCDRAGIKRTKRFDPIMRLERFRWSGETCSKITFTLEGFYKVSCHDSCLRDNLTIEIDGIDEPFILSHSDSDRKNTTARIREILTRAKVPAKAGN